MLALNHSIYAEKSALLNDIGLLLQTGERPPDRRIPILQRVTASKAALSGATLPCADRAAATWVAIRHRRSKYPASRIAQVCLRLPPWEPAAGGAPAGDGQGGRQ